MRKTLFLFCLIWSLSSSAMTGDSLHYLTIKDTIFLDIGPYHEKIFHHHFEKGQTLYSLAKFYGLHLIELYQYNPGLNEKTVQLGMPIRVPIPNFAIKRYKDQSFNPQQNVPVCYKVKKGDSLYGIAKRVFRMPVDTVMKRNQLPDPTISIGQVLQLGWMSIEGVPKGIHRGPVGPGWHKSNAYRMRFFNDSQVKKVYEEQGAAGWQKGKQQSALYVLHRIAPIGSIIEVANPMTRRTVYAKVIGRIPSSQYDNTTIVVLSSQIVSMLGAKDDRFFVQLKYFR